MDEEIIMLIRELVRDRLKPVRKDADEKIDVAIYIPNPPPALPTFATGPEYNPWLNIIELIVPRGYEETVEQLIESVKLYPDAPGVIPQTPSDGSDAVAFQFYLEDPKDIATCGYDLQKLKKLLEENGIEYRFTRSTNVKVKI